MHALSLWRGPTEDAGRRQPHSDFSPLYQALSVASLSLQVLFWPPLPMGQTNLLTLGWEPWT